MSIKHKRIELLTEADIATSPIWKIVEQRGTTNVFVEPLKSRKVKKTGSGILLGTQVTLSNGYLVWALIGNFDQNNIEMNQHFLTVSILNAGRWYHLARYHDFDYEERGPDGLAAVLGLKTSEIFPIYYDLSGLLIGECVSASAQIDDVPKSKLARHELIALAVSK